MPIPMKRLDKKKMLQVQEDAGGLRRMQRLSQRNISLSEYYGKESGADAHERHLQEAHGFFAENYQEFQAED